MRNQIKFTLLLASFLVASAGHLPGAVMFATGATSIIRGDATIGDFPELYGGDAFFFPSPLTETDARFAVTGAPDGIFLTLPGRDDSPYATAFLYAYAELTFPTTFTATGTTLTVYESGDHSEQALLWLWVTGGGFIHANATVRNLVDGYSIDLSSLQSTLDSFGPGNVFERVGVGGLDLLGESEGFDLDGVSITTSEVPEPRTTALLGLILLTAGWVKRRRN